MARKAETVAAELATALDGIAPGNTVSQDIRRNLQDPEVAEIDRQVSEALDLEARMAGELAEQGDVVGKATQEAVREEKTMTKTEKANEVLARITEGEGVVLRCKSGEVTISGSDTEEKPFTINGKDYDQEGAVKRLGRLRADILESLEVFPNPQAADEATEKNDEQTRERVGAPSRRTAQGNSDNRRQDRKPSERKKVEKVARQGYEFRPGAEIKVGEVFIADPKRGPEKLVERTEVEENGRPYLRIVLADPKKEDQTRKKGLSTTRKYEVKK